MCEALETEQTKVSYWVDSCNVGYWIHSQSRNCKPFIAHRVGEIHEDSNPEEWRYVPGKLNPADHGTRRLTVEELIENECWWGGPMFLSQPKGNWLERGLARATAESFEEVKAAVREQEESSSKFCDQQSKRKSVDIELCPFLQMVQDKASRHPRNWYFFSLSRKLGF